MSLSRASLLPRALLTSSARSSAVVRPTSVRPLTTHAAAFTTSRAATTPLLRTTTRRNFSATMSNQGVHNLTSKADFDSALGEKGLMVVDFFATWCGPCKVIAPQVVKFSNNYTSARFYKVDVDEVPEAAQEHSVRAMPTFLLFKDGGKVGEVVGANPAALEAAIKEHSA
ncbi:hypothetical protein WHR41_03915 [Cladosporium halotolerans]|uniref:Thioredoxin domain-containing protein n=1 Tax=Cladosporium halotolerans TaxID=1052096 RepID=A0AB34KQQ5_9PEZI